MKTSAVIFVVALVLRYADSAYRRCSPTEVLMDCGTMCEPSCRNPNPGWCTFGCIRNVCQCRGGYLRDERTGACVAPYQCRSGSGGGVMVVENSCGPNESVDPCGPVCEPTCDNPNPTVCTTGCIMNGCRCNRGFYRNYRGQCVEPRGCLLRG